MIMTSTVSTTDQSTGGTSADSNERLLKQIENLDIQGGHDQQTTYVATADLLDMLEQDMSNKATTKRNKLDSTVYSSGDDITNSNQRRPAQRRYSGSSIEGSFTSKLLGGYTDLIDDNNSDNDDNNNDDYGNNYNDMKGEEMADTHVTVEEEEFIPSIDDSAIKKSTSTTNYAASNYAASTNYAASNSSGKSSSDNSYPQTTIYTTPTKTQDGSGSRMLAGSASSSNNSREQLYYHSSDNSSKAHHNMAPLASRPSFDNPFRSSTNSKSSSITSSVGINNYDYGADISGSDSMGKHSKHKRNTSAGNKHKREGYGSGNSRTPKRSTNRPRPEMRGQHSVSFSIEEDQEADLSSEYMSSHMTRTTQSSDQDTFSLGSLALSAGNSSRGSHTSRASSYTSRSSKSSRSSRSSHGSATTTSTHSSGNSTERRRRRELLPVKQDRSSSKKRGQTGGGGSISSMSGSSVSGGLGSAFSGSAFSTSSPVVGMKPQKFHTHHSRRRKKASSSHTTSNSIPDDASSDGSTSSRNLYTSNRRGTTSRSNRSHGSSHHSTNSSHNSSNIKGDGEETLHANLHDHHPIHYPKRSGLYRFGEIEEGNEDDETGGMKNVDSHSDIMNGLIDTSANSEEGCGEGGKTADDVSSLGNSSLGRPTVNVVRKDSKGSSGSGGKRGGDGRGKYEGIDNSSTDEDGLFRRIDKVRNEMLNKPSSSDSFLNGLIGNKKRGSSPKKNAYNQTTTDEASEEEKSFLSNLLAKNNAARQRKGGSVKSGDASGHSESSNLSADTISQINIYQKKHNERRASLDRGANMIRQGYSKVITSLSRCYHDGGELLPNNQKEWIILLVCTFLLMPLVHVAVIHAMGDGVGSAVDFYGDQIQFTGSLVQDDQHSSLYYAGESEMAWAGSSQVMLSESSSLHENFILMPDTDWIELQISRSKAAAKKSNGGGGLNNFLFHKNDGNIKPPKRLPLPSIIDPVYNSSAAVVLYSLTASNSKKGAHSGMNEAANSDLWDAIQEQLAPLPIDAWPSWSHNSLAQFREDGFTLMYPYNQRQRARKIIKKLAKEFGQSVIYEYVTWSEMSPPADIGDAASSARSSVGFGGGTKHVGKDGYSSIVIPPMSNGRSDVMIRRTLSINKRWEEGDEPVVVMRRVKDLPVEDELTMREYEGPALEEIVWD